MIRSQPSPPDVTEYWVLPGQDADPWRFGYYTRYYRFEDAVAAARGIGGTIVARGSRPDPHTDSAMSHTPPNES